MAWRQPQIRKALDADEQSNRTDQSKVNIVLPDCLVPQPAGIALVKASLVGSLELFGSGNNCVVLQAGLLGLDEGEGVSAGGGAVVKHHTWGKRSCGETADTGLTLH